MYASKSIILDFIFTFQNEGKAREEVIGEGEEIVKSSRHPHFGKYRRKSNISEISLRLDRRRFMQVEHEKRMEILEEELESTKQVRELKVKLLEKMIGNTDNIDVLETVCQM